MLQEQAPLFVYLTQYLHSTFLLYNMQEYIPPVQYAVRCARRGSCTWSKQHILPVMSSHCITSVSSALSSCYTHNIIFAQYAEQTEIIRKLAVILHIIFKPAAESRASLCGYVL